MLFSAPSDTTSSGGAFLSLHPTPPACAILFEFAAERGDEWKPQDGEEQESGPPRRCHTQDSSPLILARRIRSAGTVRVSFVSGGCGVRRGSKTQWQNQTTTSASTAEAKMTIQARCYSKTNCPPAATTTSRKPVCCRTERPAIVRPSAPWKWSAGR